MLSHELLAALLANEHFGSRLTTFLEGAEAVIEHYLTNCGSAQIHHDLIDVEIKYKPINYSFKVFASCKRNKVNFS